MKQGWQHDLRPPVTYEEWRRVKRAVRRRLFLKRLAAADDGSTDDWPAAVERVDWTDPHEQRLPAMGSPRAMLAGMQHEQAEVPAASAGPVEVAV